jgi:catechol 2,3-dioxygenase-like lactoylglutathione lyase family enzyme
MLTTSARHMNDPEPQADRPITGLAHVGLTVSDIDAAIAFWERFLEQPVSAKPVLDRPYVGELVGIPGVRIRAAFFELVQGVRLELLQYASESHERSALLHSEPGHAHVCLWTSNADDAWARAVACGAEPVNPTGPVSIDAGQHEGLRAAYLRVPPDGHVLELFARPV